MKKRLIIVGIILNIFIMTFISASITSVSCPSSFNIVSGSTTDEQFTIIGTGGSVSYGIECDKGSQIIQPSPPKSLSTGQLIITGTFGLTTSNEIETATCTFSANDLNNPNNEKSCVFAYSSTKDIGSSQNNPQDSYQPNSSNEGVSNTLIIGIAIIIAAIILAIVLKKKK